MIQCVEQKNMNNCNHHGLLSLGKVWLACLFLFICTCLFSCHYVRPNHDVEGISEDTRDSLTHLYERHYTLNTNLEVIQDSVILACLPVKDCYNTLYKGNRVVVAEFAIYHADSVDSVWVKLAHSQDVQGWISEREMMQSFVPTDSISQFIYLFSHTHASYFIVVFALFAAAWVYRMFRCKQLKVIFINDIDSVYPLLLCLLVSFSATVYETMQVFAPETWEHFYFNPTLSPFNVPLILSLFLCSLWMFIVVLMAVIDESFRQLSADAAVFYLLGLASCCILCYFFFILTTQFYVGYLFFAVFLGYFLRSVYSTTVVYKYRCGSCGKKLKQKGKCPDCGVVNE